MIWELLDRAAEIGLREREYYKMTPAEFDRLYRGYLLRNEKADHRARMQIVYMVGAMSGKKLRPEQIWPLPISDTLNEVYREEFREARKEESDRLTKFVEKAIKKGKL